jgi:hypothetical protein
MARPRELGATSVAVRRPALTSLDALLVSAVRHLEPVDEELAHAHLVWRPLVQVAALGAHRVASRRDPHHVELRSPVSIVLAVALDLVVLGVALDLVVLGVALGLVVLGVALGLVVLGVALVSTVSFALTFIRRFRPFLDARGAPRGTGQRRRGRAGAPGDDEREPGPALEPSF